VCGVVNNHEVKTKKNEKATIDTLTHGCD